MTSLDVVVAEIDRWEAGHATVAIVGPDGTLATYGDGSHRYRWASVTKLVTALSVLIAVERRLIELDEPAGPPGSTVRHLLAHASGLTFDGPTTVARPGTRRVYSNTGFDLLGDLVAARAGGPFDAVLESFVLGPLGMSGTRLVDRPSQGLHGPMTDMIRLAREFNRPTLIPAASLSVATTVAFPGLIGLLPGVGRFDPLDWGLGFELHDGKVQHWMPPASSAATFGHFGGSGTFLWVDPTLDLAVACLTDRPYGPWALNTWPGFSDRILAVLSNGGDRPA